MKILIPYYSRSGHTERLALALQEELTKRGHSVTLEKITVENRRNKWRLVLPLLSTLPVLPLYLCVPPFRRWWLGRYSQAQQEINPLCYPDVSQFDCICLGGPKWLYIAFPIARYLQQVRGLTDKPIGVFATFCGPPLAVFEMEMLFTPLQQRVEKIGGELIQTLAISSHYHEFFFFNEMEYVFRVISRIAFRRSLSTYTLNSPWGQQEVTRFCDGISGALMDHKSLI